MTNLVGTWRLTRLALRRDRVVLPVWIASIAGLGWAVTHNYAALTLTEADRIATATLTAHNPLSRVFDGPASGTSVGALAMVDGYKVFAILTALMAVQAVVRHTRREEESGRAELVGSAVVGRRAPLASALIVGLGASTAAGAVLAVAVAMTGTGWQGAWAEGLAVAGTGWVFAAVGAVTAQVFSTGHAATGAAGAALGAAFALRAVGDLMGTVAPSGVSVVSGWPSWLSPLGWGQQVRPYDGDNWWIGGLFVALTALLVVIAADLRGHRDLGTGMVAARGGPAHAPSGLLSPLGLAWRLQRGTLGVWLVGMATMGGVFGSVGKSFADYIARNDAMRSLLETIAPGAQPLDLYQAFLLAFLGVVGAAYTVQALLRMRVEETSGRLEPVLATAVGRMRWLASHVLVVGVGSALVQTSAGLAGGLVYGTQTGEWSRAFGGILAAAAVQVPPTLALGGFVVAAFALLPRWAAPVTWFALAAALVMGQLGALLELPQWLLDVSPFTHVPAVPAEPFAAAPLVWLAVVAAGLGSAGFVAFRRRDLAIGA